MQARSAGFDLSGAFTFGPPAQVRTKSGSGGGRAGDSSESREGLEPSPTDEAQSLQCAYPRTGLESSPGEGLCVTRELVGNEGFEGLPPIDVSPSPQPSPAGRGSFSGSREGPRSSSTEGSWGCPETGPGLESAYGWGSWGDPELCLAEGCAGSRSGLKPAPTGESLASCFLYFSTALLATLTAWLSPNEAKRISYP